MLCCIGQSTGGCEACFFHERGRKLFDTLLWSAPCVHVPIIPAMVPYVLELEDLTNIKFLRFRHDVCGGG